MEKISKDKDLFHEYRTYLRLERNYSSNTIESYEMDLDKLRSYAEQHHLDIVHTTYEQLQAFLFETFKSCTSPATQARVLAGIHAWYRFLLYKDYIDQDPSELLEGPRKEKHLPTILSIDEINRIIGAIDLASNEGHRNRAIIEMLYGSGLRVSELVNLKQSNIFLDEHYMLIEGKGNKQRLVPLSPVAEEWYLYWLQERSHWPIKPEGRDIAFVNRYGRPLTRAMVFTIIKRLCLIAGIKKNESINPAAKVKGFHRMQQLCLVLAGNNRASGLALITYLADAADGFQKYVILIGIPI